MSGARSQLSAAHLHLLRWQLANSLPHAKRPTAHRSQICSACLRVIASQPLTPTHPPTTRSPRPHPPTTQDTNTKHTHAGHTHRPIFLFAPPHARADPPNHHPPPTTHHLTPTIIDKEIEGVADIAEKRETAGVPQKSSPNRSSTRRAAGFLRGAGAQASWWDRRASLLSGASSTGA